MRNTFQGLDLIDRVPDILWAEICNIVQETEIETEIKTILKKRYPKSKLVICGGLTNNCEKKSSKQERRKGKIYPFEVGVPKNNKER